MKDTLVCESPFMTSSSSQQIFMCNIQHNTGLSSLSKLFATLSILQEVFQYGWQLELWHKV